MRQTFCGTVLVLNVCLFVLAFVQVCLFQRSRVCEKSDLRWVRKSFDHLGMALSVDTPDALVNVTSVFFGPECAGVSHKPLKSLHKNRNSAVASAIRVCFAAPRSFFPFRFLFSKKCFELFTGYFRHLQFCPFLPVPCGKRRIPQWKRLLKVF